jgi:CheY-like chemotaxis protein
MVIDDEPAIGAAVARLLGREHDVTVEIDPRAALRRLARGERFDVLLCDLMMPSMTGMAFFQALCDLDPGEAERVVFITGGSLTSEVAEFTARHAGRCLQKPLDTDDLRRQIHARTAR